MAEEFDGRGERGTIVEGDISETGELASPLRTAIAEDVHLSYPHVFSYKGNCYCTPESYGKRGVYLYAFDTTREQWLRVAQLIANFAAVDPTLFEYNGRWWLFCTNHDDYDCPNTKLYLWYASDLFGPWRPHPANPVKCDVRSSRPAGRPFFFEGSLYRPAQDSSGRSAPHYGSGVVINRVTSLNVFEYQEEPAAVVYPWHGLPYRRGIHTLSGLPGEPLTVIDANRMVLSPTFVWRRMVAKVHRRFGRVAEKEEVRG